MIMLYYKVQSNEFFSHINQFLNAFRVIINRWIRDLDQYLIPLRYDLDLEIMSAEGESEIFYYY